MSNFTAEKLSAKIAGCRRRGFTLVELLVVIAILSILSAILFPAFSKAREKGRQSTCASNEKQIGLAMQQYVQDFDETYGYRTLPTGTWKTLFMPYVKSKSIFICPSNSASKYVDADGLPVSYVVNTVDNAPSLTTIGVFSTLSSGIPFPPVSAAQITTPSTTIAVLETTWTNSDFIITNGYYDQPNGPNGSSVCLFSGHESLTNYLFADGHVKAQFPAQTISTLQGGSGTINEWDRTGQAFGTPGNVATATSILNLSTAAYH